MLIFAMLSRKNILPRKICLDRNGVQKKYVVVKESCCPAKEKSAVCAEKFLPERNLNTLFEMLIVIYYY